MTQHIIEGTWEEIVEEHGKELAGRRVRLTVIPEEGARPNEKLLAAVREAERIQVASTLDSRRPRGLVLG